MLQQPAEHASANRRGATIAELLVAFAITAVVAAAGSVALVAAERQLRATATVADEERALREAESVLRAELRAADPDSITVRGDTAVELFALVGTSVACVVSGRVLVLPPDQSSTGFPFSVWRATPGWGDLLLITDSTAASGWTRAVVDSSAFRSDGAGCEPASGFITSADDALSRPALRLVLNQALPPSLVAGAPVRVMRRGRYVLLKGSDKSWALSYRSCDGPALCGPSQPVVGPLATSADSGLIFHYDPAGGTVTVDVRAPRRASGLSAPARRLLIPLPSGRAHAP